jgi:flagellar biosynthesis/type III secretory pathway M-ring protein FliF/YscJ
MIGANSLGSTLSATDTARRNQPCNHMNRKHRLVALGVVLSFTFSAWAQSQEPPKNPSYVDSLIWSVLPLLSILAIAAFVWFFLIKGVRKIQNKAMEAQKQHRETVEKLLERIAKALEKKDGSSL